MFTAEKMALVTCLSLSLVAACPAACAGIIPVPLSRGAADRGAFSAFFDCERCWIEAASCPGNGNALANQPNSSGASVL